MSLGSYLKNNRPRSIVLTVVFVLACLVFIVGVVCVISITRMMGSPSLPEADTAVNQSSVSNSESTVSSSFQGSGENGESVLLTEEELDQANANIRARNNSLGRRPSSSATNTTSQSYTTSRHQSWSDEEEYYTSSRTSSTTSREEENTSSTVSEPTTSTPEEPTTSTPEEPTTSTPEEPTSTPSVPSTSTPGGSTSTPATSTPEEPDLPADGTVTE